MGRVQRILLGAALALLAAWGAWALRRALVSDETRIRWRIEEALEAFNAGRPGSAVEPLAEDWYDRTNGLHKDTLHQILVGVLMQERGAREGFPWVLALNEETLTIAVGSEGRAESSLEASLARRRGDALETTWRVVIQAEWRDGEDGWQVVSTEHQTLSGSPR